MPILLSGHIFFCVYCVQTCTVDLDLTNRQHANGNSESCTRDDRSFSDSAALLQRAGGPSTPVHRQMND
jgi:hypothetical protein